MDLLRFLPRLSWRGIEVPITARSVSFEHDDVIHKFGFRDKELVESQGVRNWRFSYTIPFREDMTRAPYKELFSRGLSEFVGACRDREPGELFDPVLGQFRAKVVSFRDDMDMGRRDGVDVQVELIEAPLASDVVNLGTQIITDPKADAKAIDAEVERVNWQQEEPPQATVDPLSALDGLGRQVEFAGSRIGASFEAHAFKLKKLEETIGRLADPTVWPLLHSVRRARMDTLDAQRGIASTVTTTIVTTVTGSSESPVAVLAKELGMDLQAFIALNPTLARSPKVASGTSVRYISKRAA